jgi:SAM-dependent methyltransferase
MEKRTKEPQYNECFDIVDKVGFTRFGLMSNQVWYDDPRRITFLLSRYKFVSKMLSGCGNVLEVGCADAFGTRVVLQEVGRLTAIDFDPVFIEDARARMVERWSFEAMVHDILDGPVPGAFDAAYTLDVIEHIEKRNERRFIENIKASLKPSGTLIVGLPSLESQEYASPGSKEGHVNCMSADDLRKLMSCYFNNVFIFSMNDEVVHTGFSKMAHYLIALCCGPK